MMHKMDNFLTEYVTPLLPIGFKKILGYAVVDDEYIRIWFIKEDGVKEGLLLKAP